MTTSLFMYMCMCVCNALTESITNIKSKSHLIMRFMLIPIYWSKRFQKV